ncbi:DUF2974 domain-containing protein [Evansella cellulosilytica]|nr:DUF2974 domain-containing protein [Evansella cellulosilytica]
MLDYIDWRGDLTFDQAPFNDVDNLILSQLSYVNFEKIVPDLHCSKSITIKCAADLFDKLNREEGTNTLSPLIKESIKLFKRIAKSERFSNLTLSKYVNIIDYNEHKQFSAINISINKDTIFVAFRGTDNTIVGWKENFNMTFMSPVPAQIEAINYLETAVGSTNKQLILGGHSKGGNLAVYAAIKCNDSTKTRIISVYNNDGPGFHRDVIECKEYKEMLGKVKTIIPQSSIVGMMLEHEEEFVIVKSSRKVMMQHDPMSWEVLGSNFICVKSVTKESRIVDGTLKSLLNKMDESQRSQFVDALFIIFDTTNVKTIDDLTQDKWRKIVEIIKIVSSMEPENRKILTETIKLFFYEGNRVYKELKTEIKKVNV